MPRILSICCAVMLWYAFGCSPSEAPARFDIPDQEGGLYAEVHPVEAVGEDRVRRPKRHPHLHPLTSHAGQKRYVTVASRALVV
jgi:hypothetical protein